MWGLNISTMYTRRAIAQKKTKISLWVKLISALVILVIYGFLWIIWTGGIGVKAYQKVTIPAGATASQLDTILEFPVSHTRYRLWYTLFGPDLTLKQGTFKIDESVTTIDELFEALKNPTPTEDDIMFLPGWHKGEVAVELKEKWIIGDLLTEEQTLIATFTPKYPFLAGKTSLEGFLMPDTYRITGSASVEDVVGKMLQNFDRRIYQPFLASGKPIDAFYDVLILSSIVQEEEKNSTNVPTVAGILKKRLRQGIPLGADVTVCYEELKLWSECQKFVNNYYSLSREARQAKNYRYDTRNTQWLPPTPISGVTDATFLATLNATADGTALFYLHDMQWNIYTAATDAEHEQNKTNYLR
jgi:UPF0755 protein